MKIRPRRRQNEPPMHGKIAWERGEIGGDPIVVVRTEKVSEAHPRRPSRGWRLRRWPRSPAPLSRPFTSITGEVLQQKRRTGETRRTAGTRLAGHARKERERPLTPSLSPRAGRWRDPQSGRVRGSNRTLDQLEVAQAGVAVAADDQVIVQSEAERGGGLLDFLGHLDVGLGRGRVARGVVVHRISAAAPSSSARLTTSRG